eukprot:CAMPEP_0194255826 /NCGR_PEP_ID=MMETSP0158-20130606/35397_1 /TAXON_ID=33649 /ORGANISM="Thalassionema nitzschioides, Strain L26-B" /LENGTH=199 /DNA_ID=CAMNT_0038994307 /DNA_START=313 /DNA_END=912 /DNA_ORIENTATION=-
MEQKKKQKGLIFLPGALCPATAYAPLAIQLANKGIIVAVTKLAPLRWSIPYIEYDSALNSIVKDQEDNIEWNIGGHSLGAYAAMEIAKSLCTNMFFSKLVILGAGSWDKLVPDLRDYSQLEALVVQASNDPICKFKSPQDLAKFACKMPRRLKQEEIKGGNHMGFGALPVSGFDGERTISMEEQHEQVVSHVLQFLLDG